MKIQENHMTAYRSVPAPRGRSLAVAAGAAALALTATGCGLFAQAKAIPPARITITPGPSSQNVDPTGGLAVAVANGRVRKVVVRTSGDPVTGELTSHRTVWRSTQPLSASSQYTVTVVAIGRDGKKVKVTSSFSTLRPKATFHVTSNPAVDQKYGVGMPIVLTFDQPVKNRAAVERSLSLTTSVPVTGAWYWESDTVVAFRPRDFWQPGTRVTLLGRFNGVEAAKGVYGTQDLRQSFSIGPSLIVHASTSRHYMDVYYKGKLFGHWPISTGRPGDDTYDGTYLTIEKANPTFMKGPGYALWVGWAVRFTYSGEYIHSAPWSVWAQGYYNVSHGCVNTSPEHAQTFYGMAIPGDPVIVTGSPSHTYFGNGWTEWFLSWPQLVGGSALDSAVQAGPSGSVLLAASTVLPRVPSMANKLKRLSY